MKPGTTAALMSPAIIGGVYLILLNCIVSLSVVGLTTLPWCKRPSSAAPTGARAHTHVHPGTSHSLLISESTVGQIIAHRGRASIPLTMEGKSKSRPHPGPHSLCTPSSFGTRKPHLMGQIWQPLAFHSQLSSCCPLGRVLRGI